MPEHGLTFHFFGLQQMHDTSTASELMDAVEVASVLLPSVFEA